MKRILFSAALAATFAVGALAGSAGTASAAVVCNATGDCWHVDRRDRDDRYAREHRFAYHPDDWYFHQRWDDSNRRHWREQHEGRGYYEDGRWIPR